MISGVEEHEARLFYVPTNLLLCAHEPALIKQFSPTELASALSVAGILEER